MSEWYGVVPERWVVKRMAAILVQRKEKNNPVQTDFILSLSARNGVVPYTERDSSGNKSKSDLSSYAIARKDDLVVNCMNVIIGSSGISKWDGAISPVYYALFPRTSDANIEYYEYIFRSKPFYRYLRCFGKGILEIRLRISMESLNNVYLPLPPRTEQDQIVRYLNWKVSQINRLINAKKKQIDLLNEQKQVTINHAVTKGLDINVPMKDSEIDWIGSCVDAWPIVPLKRCATVRSGITLGKKYPANTLLVERPYLRVANVQNGYVDISDVSTINVTPEEADNYTLKKGDVIMTEGGDRDKLGRGCVWEGQIDPCLHQNHIFAIEVDKNLLDGYFLQFLTVSNIGREYFDLSAAMLK